MEGCKLVVATWDCGKRTQSARFGAQLKQAIKTRVEFSDSDLHTVVQLQILGVRHLAAKCVLGSNIHMGRCLLLRERSDRW